MSLYVILLDGNNKYILGWVKLSSNDYADEILNECVMNARTILLTHLYLVSYIYASTNWVALVLENGLSPIRHEAII